MSWTKIEKSMFIGNHWVDVALCNNCNGVHYPADLANSCFGGHQAQLCICDACTASDTRTVDMIELKVRDLRTQDLDMTELARQLLVWFDDLRVQLKTSKRLIMIKREYPLEEKNPLREVVSK